MCIRDSTYSFPVEADRVSRSARPSPVTSPGETTMSYPLQSEETLTWDDCWSGSPPQIVG